MIHAGVEAARSTKNATGRISFASIPQFVMI